MFFGTYDKNSKRFLPINAEYLVSAEIPNDEGVDINEQTPIFTEYLKKGEAISIKDGRIFNDFRIMDTIKEDDVIMEFKIKSGWFLPIFYGGDLLGALAVHYVNTYHVADEDEFAFIKTMVNQIAIVLNQWQMQQKNKDALVLKEEFIKEIIDRTQNISDNVKSLTAQMAKAEVKCDNHLGFLSQSEKCVENLLDLIDKLVKGPRAKIKTY